MFSDTLGPNQVCTLPGSSSGQTLVTGRNYLSAGYDMNVSDIWRRNLVVLIAFFFVFQLTQVLLIEFYPVSDILFGSFPGPVLIYLGV